MKTLVSCSPAWEATDFCSTAQMISITSQHPNCKETSTRSHPIGTMLHFIAEFLIQILFLFFFLVHTKPDKRLTHNKHAHFLPLECIVSTQSTSSVEKLINRVMSLIILPKLELLIFSWEQRLNGVFQLHCGRTARVAFGTTESESRNTENSKLLHYLFFLVHFSQ